MTNKENMSPAERAGAFINAELKRRRLEEPKDTRKGYRDRFAERLRVDPRTLNRYCREIHDVNMICEIAGILGVDIGDMLSYGKDVPGVFYS